MKILEKDLPIGLRHLLTYWQGEEVDPDIRTMICDDEISEEEEVKMFLEWCQRDGGLSQEDWKDLREILAKMD